MKKKLLSLVLAGAMVASTSVSAFAATNNTITGSEDVEHSTNVSITGDVQNDAGLVKPGNLNVTVPTAAAFTVTKDKQLAGATINITNSGSQGVDVFAYEFTDTSADENITVVGENQLSNLDRKNVSLKIRGSVGTAYLGSNSGAHKRGIYSDPNLTTAVNTSTSPVRLANIGSGMSEGLVLEGNAGSKADQTLEQPVKDNFTLVLKIKKETK